MRAAPLALDDEELAERLYLIREAFLRGAPCSPPRAQSEIDALAAQLAALEELRPDRAAAIGSLRRSLRRECRQEGLREPELTT